MVAPHQVGRIAPTLECTQRRYEHCWSSTGSPRVCKLYDEEMLPALDVRPGLTDPASIEAFDEGEELASSDEPEVHYRNVILPRKVRAQVAYARRSNLFSDGRIIARTLLRILKR
jgi:lipopolysaccharide/colanic/teichoic acid biosynthesis glycosyltransferase